jgi:hypothetical protein
MWRHKQVKWQYPLNRWDVAFDCREYSRDAICQEYEFLVAGTHLDDSRDAILYRISGECKFIT